MRSKIQIGRDLSVRIANNTEKYLGLPRMVGRRKKNAFVEIKERFLTKVKLEHPQPFHRRKEELRVLITSFIMSRVGEHYVWNFLCSPKAYGGIGFRDLSNFNKALLAKQGCKLIPDPICLLAQVMKATYYPCSDFLKAEFGTHPSFTWRSKWGTRNILESGVGWRIGDGKSRYTMVEELINPDSITWKEEVLRSLFDEDQAKMIRTIPLGNT
ncbi:reverse transcriptase [Gossypium australe]|uniref:Reverse transcriptase n=1 Tax=Gossypium australe TaxID=47621 RepID=A0A5B6VBC8_9ROSI|nr:reverse transcriptase [Gossypium australe]